MKQEDKDLLLRDLCARLPYRVKVSYITLPDNMPKVWDLKGIYEGSANIIIKGQYVFPHCNIERCIRPYLRPMLSMTKEERFELQEILGKGVEIPNDFINIVDTSIKRFSLLELQALFDWLNKKMFDYRGLIEKGLALEAFEDMYK